MLSKSQNQGQTVSSQNVVATYRLPWHFQVGKRQDGQGAAAPADVTLPFRDGGGSANEQDPIPGDSPTPRPCAGAELRAPTLEPMMLSSPGPSSLYMGGYQAANFVFGSGTQALAARSLGAKGVAKARKCKRRRDEADLDDEDSQMFTGRRRVPPRPSTGGSSAPRSTRAIKFRVSADSVADSYSSIGSSAAQSSIGSSIAPSSIAPSSISNSFPIGSSFDPYSIIPFMTPSSIGPYLSTLSSVDPWVAQPDLSLHPVQVEYSDRPAEPITTVLRGANPRRGPVSGGIEIWLDTEDLPTTFTLYAKFGDGVAVTVSSTFHLFSSSNSTLVGSECVYAIMYSSLHKSSRSRDGYTISFSLA